MYRLLLVTCNQSESDVGGALRQMKDAASEPKYFTFQFISNQTEKTHTGLN